VKLKAYSEVLCKIIYVLEQGINIFSYLALLPTLIIISFHLELVTSISFTYIPSLLHIYSSKGNLTYATMICDRTIMKVSSRKFKM
jgi:hypothetical protein